MLGEKDAGERRLPGNLTAAALWKSALAPSGILHKGAVQVRLLMAEFPQTPKCIHVAGLPPARAAPDADHPRGDGHRADYAADRIVARFTKQRM